MPYIETPNIPVNKAIQYHWWSMRYNSIDAQNPSYGFMFPNTMEGVLGYNNAIVLTQGMHIQDTGYFRTGRLAYGGVLAAGNQSMSSAYLDNQGTATSRGNGMTANWNAHYNQYIGSAGTQVFKTLGGRADMAFRLAYDFSGDAQGQLDHFRGSTTGNTATSNNFLMSHNNGYTTGNDADGIAISDTGGRKDR